MNDNVLIGVYFYGLCGWVAFVIMMVYSGNLKRAVAWGFAYPVLLVGYAVVLFLRGMLIEFRQMGGELRLPK